VDEIAIRAFSPQTSRKLVELAVQRMSEIRPSVLYGDFLACNDFDISTRLAEIQQPTLILCGADDQMTPPRYAQFLASGIPDAELALIPEASHMLMLEQPTQVAKALIDFLSGISY
jgi:pimeloyl-ACP methyl ester carboxylesterase